MFQPLFSPDLFRRECCAAVTLPHFLSPGNDALFEKARETLGHAAGRGDLVVRSRLWSRRVPGSKPDSTEDPSCMGLLHAKSYIVAKRPPVGMAWKFGEGAPAQVSSSSADRGSKLRGPSQSSPLVASKRDVNITKLLKI
ncbi:hypothetical protein AVEN_257614-1 [Araneus ventricosus]|uniref:Uncharacterized protein n=1 Tax=Araneus ventricosus TaxID=182803 RepID=A0A4Y2E4S0_ARAVE|nr:hypothetical protein AVEN_257614-1 [Araneus ventricosus]